MTEYNHYIRMYPKGNELTIRQNIKTKWGAIFRSLTNTAPGEVKNQYVEDYAESPTPRVFLPTEPVYAATEQVMSLYFKGDECMANSQAMYDALVNRKFEFYDDYRGRYFTFMLKKMEYEKERLFSNQKYQMVKLTLTNLYGRSFAESQVPT